MSRTCLRGALSGLAVLAALSLLSAPAAYAIKDEFVRTKPHINSVTPTSAKKKTKSDAPKSLYFPEPMLDSRREHPDFLWMPTPPHSNSSAKSKAGGAISSQKAKPTQKPSAPAQQGRPGRTGWSNFYRSF